MIKRKSDRLFAESDEFVKTIIVYWSLYIGAASRSCRFKAFAFVFFVYVCPIANAKDRLEALGDGLQILTPTIAYGATFYMDDSDGRLQFYESFATTILVTHLLKETINKERPNGGDHSFPSGHTSAAFQGSAFIHRRYGFKYAIPAYASAVLVGYSRVASDQHYIEDVVVGAIIGIASSFYFVKQYRNLTILPFVADGTYGISAYMRW